MSNTLLDDIQRMLDEGLLKVIDLGVINGMHRYRFIENKECEKENQKDLKLIKDD